jgi:hypothetical protein
LILEFYQSTPFKGPMRSRRQEDSIMRYEKPKGLWVSVRGPYDWAWWSINERFRLKSFKHRYLVELSQSANILYITSIDELDAFTEEFGETDDIAKMPGWNSQGGRDLGINWKKVAKKYHGIIISPYQWERRLSMNSSWYYGWDCASGCIWNGLAVKSITEAPLEGLETVVEAVQLAEEKPEERYDSESEVHERAQQILDDYFSSGDYQQEDETEAA